MLIYPIVFAIVKGLGSDKEWAILVRWWETEVKHKEYMNKEKK